MSSKAIHILHLSSQGLRWASLSGKGRPWRIEAMGSLTGEAPDVLDRWLGQDHERAAALHDMSVLQNDRFTMKGVREQNLAITRYVTTRERAQATLTMPVLVLHGDEDPLVDVKYGRELHEILPHSRYVEFEGAAHNYLIAAGPRATQAFMSFIDEVDARPHAA